MRIHFFVLLLAIVVFFVPIALCNEPDAEVLASLIGTLDKMEQDGENVLTRQFRFIADQFAKMHDQETLEGAKQLIPRLRELGEAYDRKDITTREKMDRFLFEMVRLGYRPR